MSRTSAVRGKKKMCSWLDSNANVKCWGFEIVNIPYLFEIDRKVHKYITDFYVEILDNNGQLKKYIIEVKPKGQLRRPIPPKIKNKKALRRYSYEMNMYIKNLNKWKATIAFCKSRGLIFKIVTETDLF